MSGILEVLVVVNGPGLARTRQLSEYVTKGRLVRRRAKGRQKRSQGKGKGQNKIKMTPRAPERSEGGEAP
jgi:hypothetical protein